MSININSINSAVNSGARLILKSEGLSPRVFRDAFKSIGNAKTASVVTVEKDGVVHNILSLKDNEGRLTQRVFRKYSNGSLVSTIQKSYEYKPVRASGSVLRNTVAIETSPDLTQKTYDSMNVINKGGHKLVVRSKYQKTINIAEGLESEHQEFARLHPKERIKMVAKDVTTNFKTPENSIEYYLACGLDVDKFAKDKFFLQRYNQDNADFAEKIEKIAKKNKKVTNDIDFAFEKIKKPSIRGYYMGRKIRINNSLLTSSKESIVNVVNHEMRHALQSEISNKYFSFGNIFSKGKACEEVSNNEKKLAQRFWQGFIFYPLTKIHKKIYRNNILEKDAFKFGKRSENEYQQGGFNLLDEFPELERSQVGLTNLNSGIKYAIRFLKGLKPKNE